MRSTNTATVGLAFGALLGLASVSLAHPAAAVAQTGMETPSAALIQTEAPAERGVRIVSCAARATANVAQTTENTASATPPMISGIDVAFINRSGTAADSVGFTVSYAGEQRHIVDKGHFSPGTRIDHTFLAFAGVPFLGETPDSCTVAGVHFEDGTMRP